MTYLIGPLGENNWICLAQLPHSSGKQAYLLRTGVLCSLRPSTASQEEADAGIVCGPIGFLPALSSVRVSNLNSIILVFRLPFLLYLFFPTFFRIENYSDIDSIY